MHEPHSVGLTAQSRWGLFFGIISLIAVFGYIQPDIFWLRVSPMNGDGWSIKDPTVSWAAFMPSFREFKYELFHNANILWSNLRAMGQPMLGNGVQGAPLFPLSLALIWLPDQLFWTVMPMTRIFLIGVMLFLLARNFFNFPVAAALVFALLAAYNINVFRWINHPWTNGALSGVWYLYFMLRITFAQGFSPTRQTLHAIGLVLGIIGMVTNGFPEASALFAIIAAAVYLAIVLARFGEVLPSIASITKVMLLLHFVGFALCSVQIIALLEYIDYTQIMGLREGYISGTWQAKDAHPYALSQFSIFWKTEAQRRYLSFTVGVFGAYMALQGLLCLLMDFRKNGKVITFTGIAFILTMTLFAVKGFGLSDTVEWVFSKTPVLDVSHFPLYFSPLFYFGSAFFAALGLRAYFHSPSESKSYHAIKAVWALASFAIIVRTIEAYAQHFSNMKPRNFWINQLHGESFDFLWPLLPIVGGLIAFHIINAIRLRFLLVLAPYKLVAFLGSTLVLAGITLEQRHIVKGTYAGLDSRVLFRNDEELALLNQALEESGLERHQLRTRNQTGDYVQYGIATIDNGASAMLPPDLRRIRIAMYDAPYGGYLSLKDQRYPWSGWMVSNNLTLVHSTPFSEPDWGEYSSTTELQPTRPAQETGYVLKRQNPYYFFGFTNSFSKPHITRVWLKISNDGHLRWLEANIGHQTAKNVDGKLQTRTLWRAKLTVDELRTDQQYEVIVRLVDESSKRYQDLAPLPLSIAATTLEDPKLSKLDGKFLGRNDSGSRSAFLETNALPRAFVASSCDENVDNNTALIAMQKGIRLLNGHVLVNGEFAGVCDSYSNQFSAITVTEDKGSRLEFASVSGPAVVLINDSFYPGWKAEDLNTGEEFKIQRANVATRAIFLPEEKEYQLAMKYRPNWLLWVVLAKLLAMSAFVWHAFSLRRRF